MPITMKKSSMKYKNSSGSMQEVGLPVGSYETDSSLTRQGIPADAKAVGDEFSKYYEKSDTYSKTEFDSKLSSIPKFKIEVVNSLPTSNISSTTVYLVKSGDETQNLYTEYIYVNNTWEYLGKQSVDLTGYALKSDVPSKTSQLTNDSNFVTKNVTDSLENEIDNLTVYATPQMYEGTDTEKIQQAINENKYVLIPVGTYNISSTITIPSDRKIQIDGTINVGCAVGFLLHGEYIDICGKGTINIGTSTCSAIKALVDTSIGFIKIRDITMWGAWNQNNSNNHIGVEFVGGSTLGTCCYVNIDCYINCMTKAVWTHKATGQNANSWITQIDINSTIQNCQQAIVFDWMGDMSRIRGVIQPKVTSAVTPNSVDLPLCILPEYGYIDSAIWDMDGAINKYAIKVNGNYCTILSAIGRSYIDINIAYEPTLTLRIPTDNLVTKEYFEENKPSLNVNFHIDEDGNLIMEENAPYTNLVPSGKDTDGSILNDVGYVDNYRISASGNITGQTGTVLTGCIPYREVSDLDDIKTKGVSYVADLYCGIMLYDKDFKLMGGLRLVEGQEPTLLNETVAVLNTSGSSISTVDGITTIHLNFIEDNLVNNPVSYFRLFAKGKGSDLIVTRKEEIVDYDPSEKNVGKVVPETNANIAYGVCDTAADVADKTVTVEGNFELKEGAFIIIRFINANSIASPTLNVNGTGAKPMYRYGTTTLSTGTTTTGWVAGAVQMFTYNGEGWIRDYWNNTTYSNASLGCGYATCSTAAATVAKTATLSSYSLTTGGMVAVKFTNAVPAKATLNINSKGAKNIYYKGAAITADVIKAGDIATFVYSSQYHLISVDRLPGDTAATTTEEWTFTLEDGSTVTKKVVLA